MATVHANNILTKFMLLLGGHNHCVKVSSDSETVRGMGLWEFSGALRELMLRIYPANFMKLSPLFMKVWSFETIHGLNFNTQRQKRYAVTNDIKVNFLIFRFVGCMKNMPFLANICFYYP